MSAEYAGTMFDNQSPVSYRVQVEEVILFCTSQIEYIEQNYDPVPEPLQGFSAACRGIMALLDVHE